MQEEGRAARIKNLWIIIKISLIKEYGIKNIRIKQIELCQIEN